MLKSTQMMIIGSRGLLHEFLEPAIELLLDLLHLFLILHVQRLLLQIEVKTMQNEVLKAVEHVLLDEAQVAGKLFVVDELLDLVVKANALHRGKAVRSFCMFASFR